MKGFTLKKDSDGPSKFFKGSTVLKENLVKGQGKYGG